MALNMKDCPFCGGSSQELSLGMPDHEGTPVAMNCTECGAVGPWIYVASDATPGAMLFSAGVEWDKRSETENASDR